MQRHSHRQPQAGNWIRSLISNRCQARLPAAAGTLDSNTVPAQSVTAPVSLYKQQPRNPARKELQSSGSDVSRPLGSGFASSYHESKEDDMDGYSHYTRAEAIQVTIAIGQSTTWQQLSQLYKQHRTQLWHINIAAMFRQLSKLHLDSASLHHLEVEEVAQLQSFYTQLGYTAARAAHSMQPRELCTIASAAAQLGLLHPWLSDALADATAHHLRSGGMTLRQAAQLTHAFGKMSFTPPQTWLQALTQATQPLIAVAALQAALAVHGCQSDSKLPVSQRPRRAKGHSSTIAGQGFLIHDQDQSQGQYSQRSTGQLGQDVVQPGQNVAQGHLPGQGARAVAVQPLSDSVSRSLANLLHALACRMRVMPSIPWLHTWLLATQQCLVPAQVNAGELVQMLQALAVLTCTPSHTDSSSSRAGDSDRHLSKQSGLRHSARIQQNQEGNGQLAAAGQQQRSGSIKGQLQQAQVAGQMRQLLVETQWLNSCCSALQSHAADMTPTMAQAALSALAVVAQPHGARDLDVQAAALALLQQACADSPYPAAVPSKAHVGQQQRSMQQDADAVEMNVAVPGLMAGSDSARLQASGMNARRLGQLLAAVRDLQVPKGLLRQNEQLEQLVRQHTETGP